MRIYIASKYIEHRDKNRKICATLQKSGFEVFLPETIDVDAITDEEMWYVGEACYNELVKCDVILVVAPVGLSVTCEIAYTIALKREMNKDMHIVVYGDIQKREAMLQPYVDKTCYSTDELIEYLQSL